jgi:hypothetical protein
MPAAKAVARKQLVPARARESEDVLHVGAGGGKRAANRGVERPAHRRQEQHGCDARPDLEGPVRDVFVRHPVARQVQEQADRQRREPRPDDGASSGAGCYVE